MSAVPPNDLPAERALLTALLVHPDWLADVIEHVDAADFYGPAESRAFALMLALDADGKPVDVVTIAQAARANGTDGLVHSVWLSELMDEPLTGTHVACAKSIRARSRQRAMLEALRRLTVDGSGQNVDVDKWISECERTVYDLAQHSTTNVPEDISETTKRVLETLANRAKGERDYIPSTLSALNRVISGWVPGRVHVVAARPGNGKTALVLQETVNVATRGLAVVVVSLEMGRDELVERALSQIGLVNNQRMLRGELVNADWTRLSEAADSWTKLPVAIVDNASLTVGEMRSVVRRQLTRLRRVHGAGLRLGAIVIDYIQLMHGQGEGQEALADVSNGIREMAKETGAVVVVVSQLNRDSKTQGGGMRRPQMTDLRGSGQIEQDAHKIVFIHNENGHLPEDQQTPERVFIVAKNRGGKLGDAHVNFQGEFTRFIVPADPYHDVHDPAGGYDNE